MPAPLTRRAALALLTAALTALGTLPACTSLNRAPEPGVRPDDFALSISLYRTAAPLEPAWYVLEPDGDLRIALGQRTPRSPQPPVVRNLTPSEVARVYEELAAANLLTIPEGAQPVSEMHIPAEPGAVVFVAGQGKRRAYFLPGVEAEAAAPIVRTLRSFAGE